MKIVKKLLNILFTLLISISIFSCEKFNFSISSKTVIATESEVKKEEENNYGDNLTTLTGQVSTLSKYELPIIGDILYGFRVDGIYDYDMKNAKLVVFTHEKSGARAILISNDDEDKSTVIGFNTLTYDNRGIPHVFEHACLGGSAKYPNANTFDEAVSKIYQTFMNAFTMQHATIYPCSSLSDLQLFELYKFYLDGVMNPDVLRDEKNLEREAYRYILNNKNDDLSLSGIVYSEMSANESNINRAAYQSSKETMFEGSFMASETGGVTTDIIKIENKDLIEYHEKYYHPSNMVITLYGDIDYKKYLKYSDEEYLNKFNKIQVDKSDDDYKNQEGFKIKKYDFPVSENDDIDKQSVIVYGVSCENMSAYESGIFDVVLSALSKSDGPIDRRLKEKLPSANFSCDDNLFYPKPFFLIEFTNVDEKDADTIKNLVEDSFAEIINDGIKKDIVDEIADELEIEKEMSKDSHGFSSESANFYVRVFSNNGEDILGDLRYNKGLADIKKAFENGDITKLAEKYLSSNDKCTLVAVVPKKGLLEEKNNAVLNSLKNKKASMTEEEINALILKNKEFDEWNSNQSKNSIINTIKVASISSLDEYRAACYAYEETNEGVHFIRSDIKDAKSSYFNVLFDASGVKYEDIHKLNFISELFLEMPTTHYDGKKLGSEIERYTSAFHAGPSVKYYDGGGYKPYFSFSVRALDNNLNKAFELLEEMMYETKFEDIDKARNIALSCKNGIKQSFNSNPARYTSLMTTVQNDNDYLYENYLNGVEYLKFLSNIEKMSDDEVKTLLTDCKELLLSLYNRSGLVCELISNFDTMKLLKSKLIELSYDFVDEKIKEVDYSEQLIPLKNRIALVCNGTMQYNNVSMPMMKNDIEYNGKHSVLKGILDINILFNEFRAKRSVYGSYSDFNKQRAFIYTYRDPNLKETYSVFKTIPSLLRKIKISDEELDNYKLNAYSKVAYPLTKFSAATIAIEETLTKTKVKRPDRYVGYMRDIKALTTNDLDEMYKLVDELIDKGKFITAGSREQIENNKDMFDEIIYDYVE